jgi:multiple sugar transport system permease protein
MGIVYPDRIEQMKANGEPEVIQFRDVTLPMLAPIVVMVSILTIAGYFQLFAEPYVMSGGGPPLYGDPPPPRALRSERGG